MGEDHGVLLGKGETYVELHAALANRHGLIAGATGTGKTVSLQLIAEGLSRLGVPVFVTDVKGDLSGISRPGSEHPKISERLAAIGGTGNGGRDDGQDHGQNNGQGNGLADFAFEGSPTVLWDIDGEHGHPVRATITDMGPALLARLMDLNDTQEGILNIAFRFADDEGMLMLDLKDLQYTLRFIGDNAREFRDEYGNVSPASVGAIQRRLLVLEEQGAERFFGEPELDLWDLIRTTRDGRGHVNILDARALMLRPKLYGTFLLWLLSELFEELPEVGDLDTPRFVFFFDEAHLLFADAPKVLVDKVATVVKLIRSKGVGVYFVTQNPLDVPDAVLGQLGNRVQHALRAFTPRDQKAVKVAAETLRRNPAFDTRQVIAELGVGEALVSTLQPDGTPGVVQRVLMSPPRSRIGPATEAERAALIRESPIGGRYDRTLDRESAFELLEARVKRQTEQALQEAVAEQQAKEREKAERAAGRGRGRGRQTLAEAAARTFVRSISSRLATRVVRGLLGSVMRR